MNKSVHIKASVSTNKGNIKEYNQDNYYLNGDYMDEHTDTSSNSCTTNSRHEVNLFAVCDGVGRESMGELASRTVVESLRAFHLQCSHESQLGVEKRIRQINRLVNDTNRRIVTQNDEQNPGSMGSTMSAMMIYGSQVVIAHIGDSKVFMFRKNSLSKLTTDHTEAQKLLSSGLLKPEEVKFHRSRSRLTRCFGMPLQEGGLSAELNILSAQKGDIFLLCSDGLTDMVEEQDMIRILAGSSDLDKSVAEMMELAMSSGGADNITIMAVGVEALEESLENRFSEILALKKTKPLAIPFAIAASIAVLATAVLWGGYAIQSINQAPAWVQTNTAEADKKIQETALPATAVLDISQGPVEPSDTPVAKENTQELISTAPGEKADNAAPIPEPSVKPAIKPAIKPAKQPAPVTQKIPKTYKVQKGDTIYSISRKFFGNIKMVGSIVKLNNLTPEGDLAIGQVLMLPEN